MQSKKTFGKRPYVEEEQTFTKKLRNMTLKREHNSRGVEKVSQFSLRSLLAELISKVKYKTIFYQTSFLVAPSQGPYCCSRKNCTYRYI